MVQWFNCGTSENPTPHPPTSGQRWRMGRPYISRRIWDPRTQDKGGGCEWGVGRCAYLPHLYCSNMLPAQLVNVAEAGLGPLPTTRDFLDRLKLAMEPPTESNADVGLFGDTFSSPIPLPPGSVMNQKGTFLAITTDRKSVV